MEDHEIDTVVKSYFSAEEWANLADILKIRYRNMYKHFTTIPGAELFMPMPEFMQRGKIKDQNQGSSSTKLDINKNEIKIPKRKQKEKESIVINRYPKREVPKINYFEEEEPNQDRYIFCDNCGQEYLDFCTKCGMLSVLRDCPVPMNTEDRAKKTVPKGVLDIRPSPIHGFGVFASRDIRQGVQMGPYEGSITRIDTTNGYAWKLRDGRLINAGDESKSNWMRYVNCARKMTEQNIVAFQYKGNLYYRSSKQIKKGEELLVYYGQSFARILGIDTKNYFHPVEEEVNKDFFCCKHCHIGLSTMDYRDSHEVRCRFKAHMLKIYSDNYVCKFCSCWLTTKEYLEKHEKYCSKRVRSKQKSAGEGDNVARDEAAKKKFQCRYCSYSSKWKHDVTNHTKIIHEKHNAMEYRCEKCTYKTYHKSDLLKHLRQHYDGPHLKCQDCQKNFNQKSYLDNHILKHHKGLHYLITSKINKCQFCNYKTVRSTHMSRHLKHKHIKNGVKNFHCYNCDYTCIQKGDLKRHILFRHSFFKLIVCVKCKKQFVQKTELDSHILNYHGDDMELIKTITSKIHNCTFCSYKTVYITHMKDHIKARHKNKTILSINI